MSKRDSISSEAMGWRRNTLCRDRKIRKENLLLLKKLAGGKYGAIYEAEVYNLVEYEGTRKVLAKLLQSEEINMIKEFEDDVSFLMSLNHVNVVGLLGLYTEEPPKCYVFDCGQTRDLLVYVRELKNKGAIQNLLQPSNSIADDEEEEGTLIENPVSASEELFIDLLTFADHITLGMDYLSTQKNYVHKDLALRNCIIGHNNVVKVTVDNELAKLTYLEAYNDGLPIRWMSPESLLTNMFTAQSDVWSFGIALWELTSLGEVPYYELTDNTLVIQAITNDDQLPERPILCNKNTFVVMTDCWEKEPNSRPTFLQLHEHIYKLTINS